MKSNIIFIGALFLLSNNYAQNNSIVINNDAFIVLDGGSAGSETVVVVDQTNASGIITTGTGGNIITMGEFDYLKWNTKTGTGNFVIPFTTDIGLTKIPLSVNISGAGVGNGYLALSTWDVSPGAGNFDNTPYPSDVIHMTGADGSADVSENVVDRFWIIDISDPLGTGELFTTAPVSDISFSYNTAAAEVGDGNSITLGDLVAQHYDGASNKWFGWFSAGVANGVYGVDNGSGIVSGVVPPAGAWYRTWTLSDKSSPLPVEMTYFYGNCEKTGVVLEWQTASEINNDFFEIQKSLNGVDFDVIAKINGVGNSSSFIDYSYTDPTDNNTTAFYRISQVDYDGTRKDYPVVKTAPCHSSGNVNIYSALQGEITLDLYLTNSEDVSVVVLDNLGKQIGISEQFTGKDGFNQFKINYNNLAFGNYFVVVTSPSIYATSKLILK
jgi:hypothetical protein